MKDTTHCPERPSDIAADAPSVMLVDDEADMRWVLQCLLLDSGYQITEADSGKTFREAMLKPPPDVVLLDLKLPDASGLDLLTLIQQEWPHTEVIMLTGFASIETAMQAIRLGAYDYQQKPLDYKALKATIERALEHRRLRLDSEQHRRDAWQRQKLMDLLRINAAAANDARRVKDVAQPMLTRFCEFLDWPVGHLVLFPDDNQAPSPHQSYWQLAPTRNYSVFQKTSDDRSLDLRNDWIAGPTPDSDVRCSADVTREEDFLRKHAAKACGLKTALCVPIVCHGRQRGAFEFYAGSVAPPSEKQRVAAAQLAGQFARVLEREMALTELRRSHENLEAAVAQQERRIEELQDRVEQGDRKRHALIDALHLECRAPMTDILNAAKGLQTLSLGSLNRNQTVAANIIWDQSDRLRRLADNLLDVSHFESGAARFTPTPVDLPELCASVANESREAALRKGVEIQLRTESAPTPFVADHARLSQLLSHLLNNAVKFTPRNGRVGLEATWFGSEDAPAFIIWDTGVGIHEADQQRIFEPFVRLDCIEGGDMPGPGLGLTLARGIAANLGGTIELDSSPGQGSRFAVLLPAAPSSTKTP